MKTADVCLASQRRQLLAFFLSAAKHLDGVEARAMAFAVGLPNDLQSLAVLLGVAPQRLFYLVKSADSKYVNIEIPKSQGGVRQIDIPSRELKGVQRLLYRSLFIKLPVHEIAAAYKPTSSITAAARKHAGPTSILRMDFTDFFPSITNRRLFGYFVKQGFNRKVSFMLTRLVTYKGHLPQGAPTSPCLSNAICNPLDHEISAFARSWNLTVTRYSDDIIFSGIKFDPNNLANRIEEMARRHGFQINRSKTKYLRRGQPQRVLGLLVDKYQIRMTRSMHRNIRAAFHKASSRPTWGTENSDILRGYAQFYKQVYGADDTYRTFNETLSLIDQIKSHEVFEA